MSGIFSAFDSFLFKSFDFGGRSSRAEYWMVMPVIWTVMIGLLWFDGHGFWKTLEAGETPSLNPLTYGSVLFVLVTLIPRFSLAVRRLHDSGRRAKWAGLPYTALFLGVMATLGLATSGLFTIGDPEMGYAIPLMLMFDFSSADGIARTIYYVVSNLDQIHFASEQVGMTDAAANAAQNVKASPSMAAPMLIVALLLLFGPPFAIMLYTFLMTLPSEEDENIYGVPVRFDHGPKRTAKGEHNAFASYAVLTRTDRAPSESEVAARKAEVHSLYEERVLGRGQG